MERVAAALGDRRVGAGDWHARGLGAQRKLAGALDQLAGVRRQDGLRRRVGAIVGQQVQGRRGLGRRHLLLQGGGGRAVGKWRGGSGGAQPPLNFRCMRPARSLAALHGLIAGPMEQLHEKEVPFFQVGPGGPPQTRVQGAPARLYGRFLTLASTAEPVASASTRTRQMVNFMACV